MFRSVATLFSLKTELTPFRQSRSRLRDIWRPEPDPPKKVAAPQNWLWIKLHFTYLDPGREISFNFDPDLVLDPIRCTGLHYKIMKINLKLFFLTIKCWKNHWKKNTKTVTRRMFRLMTGYGNFLYVSRVFLPILNCVDLDPYRYRTFLEYESWSTNWSLIQ